MSLALLGKLPQKLMSCPDTFLDYVITYFGQVKNYVGQVKIINDLPGMASKF